ncbi:hypothetical protein TcCL_NonESM07845 [Trypanosoma cruzi]|nr:hypothetical protein TcCL_NonESM07845 [Trypanosoma cruzi]
MCPHTVDGQLHSAAGWAGGRQSAARWSARSCGAHVGKRFRRRQRRAGHRSEGGTAPPTQRVPCDPQGACGLSKSGQESHRACAQCRHSGTDVRVNTRNRALATPTGASHAVCSTSFSSCTSFHYNLLKAVRKSTCQAVTQSCERDRAITASASAVALRGIPQCHGENVDSAV